MNIRQILITVVIFSLFLVGCADLNERIVLPNTGEREQPAQTERATEDTNDRSQEPGGFDDFVASLEAAGAQVEVTGDFSEQIPFFNDVSGFVLQVNGADVHVIEFASADTRASAENMLRDRSSTIQNLLPDWITQANIWRGDRIIVLYVGEDSEIIRLISGVLGDPFTISNDQESPDLETARQIARQIIQAVGPFMDRITFLSIEREEFSDACLDLPEQDESCAQIITPGFVITVELNGQQFVFHIDESGENIRQRQ
jgi:hypothetical protein